MGLFHPKNRIRGSVNAVGDRTELFLISSLIDAGYNVLTPVNSGLRYDLVIEDADCRFWRIQCKTGRYKNGVVEFSTTTFNHTTTAYKGYAGAADYFAVYCKALNKAYLVPVSHVPVGHGKLRIDEVRHKLPSTKWAQDYEL